MQRLLKSVVILFSCAIMLAAQTPSSVTEHQINSEIVINNSERIETLGKNSDFSGVQQLLSDERSRLVKDTLKACYELTLTIDIDYTARMRVVNNIALPILLMSDYISLDEEVQLLGYIANDTGVWIDDEWVKMRGVKARLYLHSWMRLKFLLDVNYDPQKDVPQLNVVPPPGAHILPGGDPADIKDPQIRAEYEAMVAENAKKIRYHTEQIHLKELNDSLPRRVEQYLLSAYSRAPYNIEELRVLLNQFAVDRTIRERIVNSVAGEMGLN